MSHLRHIVLTIALVTAASALVACNTAPTMPMSAASANSMAISNQMARMDAQMKTMRDMHEKMVNARTPEERNALMAEHMKTMQDGMKMMGGMSSAGMGDMMGMKGMQGMADDKGARQQMMEKRMEMMESMMQMMVDRLPPPTAK